jgi:hypothetical protein
VYASIIRNLVRNLARVDISVDPLQSSFSPYRNSYFARSVYTAAIIWFDINPSRAYDLLNVEVTDSFVAFFSMLDNRTALCLGRDGVIQGRISVSVSILVRLGTPVRNTCESALGDGR